MNPNPPPTPTVPEGPLPAPGTAPANLMVDLFPGASPPSPSPAPAPGTPAEATPFPGTFGIDIGTAPQPAPAPAPASTAPATPSAGGGFSIEDFVSRHIADPESIFQGDGRKISQFRELRGLFEGATRDLAAAQLELTQLRQAGGAAPAPGAGSGAPLPETEAVQKLTAEIEALKPAAQRWQEQEARQNLRQNPAFRHEFDQPRAAILREIEATASEVGLEKKDVEEFLRLDTEFKQAKWIKDHVEDDVAAQLYKEKGREFLGLSNQAKTVLESDDPIAALREWDDYNSAFASKFAAKLEESAARELQSATGKVVSNLMAGDNPFFATDSGKAVLSDLNRRASEGRGFSAEEVVESMALASAAPVYQALAQNLQQRALAAEQELARLKSMNPNPIPPDPMRGGEAPAPGDLYGFGSADGAGIRPLIRADQIRHA